MHDKTKTKQRILQTFEILSHYRHLLTLSWLLVHSLIQRNQIEPLVPIKINKIKYKFLYLEKLRFNEKMFEEI